MEISASLLVRSILISWCLAVSPREVAVENIRSATDESSVNNLHVNRETSFSVSEDTPHELINTTTNGQINFINPTDSPAPHMKPHESSPSSQHSDTSTVRCRNSSSPDLFNPCSDNGTKPRNSVPQSTSTEKSGSLLSTEKVASTTGRPSNGPETIAGVRQVMEQTGLMPLAAVGIVLNVLALWVWQTDSTYNAVTFLFKYLAVWDSLCLVTFLLYVGRIGVIFGKVVLSVSNISQRVSVHTTLLATLTRWLAVSRPLHVRSLLSATRVRLACLGLLVWCTLVEGLFLYASYARLDRQTSWTVYYLQRVLGLALPLVLMLIFNVLLIVKSHAPRQQLGLCNQQQTLEARNKLTRAVVCVSLCSLIAYPIGIVTETATNVECYQGNVYVCDRLLVYIIKYVTFVLQIINLGINFVFYVAFASRFRQLLAMRIRCCCCCYHNPAETEPPGTTVEPVENSAESYH